MVLPELMTGDVVLCSPKDWIGRAITKFEKIPYSHVAVIVKNWDIPMFNESLPNGVHSTPAKDRFKEIKKVKILRLNNGVDEKRFAQFANSYLGKVKYDFWGTLVCQGIYQTTGKWIGKKGVKASEKMYCSEYVAKIYNDYNSQLFEQYYKTDPEDFFHSLFFYCIFEGKFLNKKL